MIRTSEGSAEQNQGQHFSLQQVSIPLGHRCPNFKESAQPVLSGVPNGLLLEREDVGRQIPERFFTRATGIDQ